MFKINKVINKIYYLLVNRADTEKQSNFYNYHKKFRHIRHEGAKEIDDFMVPFWKQASEELGVIFDKLNYSFLNRPLIGKTMFISGKPELRKAQLNFLRRVYGDKRLKDLLREEVVGNPLIENWSYRTSHNTIHHLSHLTRFSNSLGVELAKINTVVEWGGGYGNMARLFKKLSPSCTYIIIDLPVFSALQSVYLASIFGENSVHVLNCGGSIEKGKINIVPLSSIGSLELNDADLFISTWALTESSEHALSFVNSKSYFNSKYLLMAHVKDDGRISAATDKITAYLNGYETIAHEKIENLKNNYYLFCKKHGK